MELTRTKRYVMSTLSGVLFFISFPFTGSLTPLVFVAWLPLLLVEHYLLGKRYRWQKLLPHAYLTFLLYNIGTTWWIWNASIGGACLAFLLNSLLMTLTFLIAHAFKRKLGTTFGNLAFVTAWLCFEYLHYNWELSWPWLNLGNTFSIRTNWIQWYSYTGVLGGTLWILLVNLSILQFVLHKAYTSLSKNWLSWSFVLATGIVPIVVSYLVTDPIVKTKPTRITIVQPNINPYTEKFSTPVEQQLTDMLKQAETVKPTDLVIFPETAISASFFEKDLVHFSIFKQMQDWIHTHGNPKLLIGASTQNFFLQKHSRASIKLPDGPGYVEQYNSSLFLQEGKAPRFVHKSKLVLGVEKIPYSNILPFLEDLAIQNGGTSGTLGIEKEPKILTANNMRFAPLICYESIYGEFNAEQCAQGVDFIAIITNDGWWKNTPGHRQHMSFSRLRAIENHKYVIRSANTGISAVVDPNGNLLKRTNYNEKATIYTTIYNDKGITFYALAGDAFGKIASWIFLLLCFIYVYRYLRGPKISPLSV